MQAEHVRHIMTEAVLTIGVHEPITEALRLFASHPVHHLPVVDGSELKGMLSSADMLKLEHFIPKSSTPASIALLTEKFHIDTLMRQPVVTAALDDTIADAALRMVSHGVHALPVVNDDNHLVGIVTTSDIMQALLHGIGFKTTPTQDEVKRQPTELEMRHILEAANLATLNGTDTAGIAACLLFLHERNVLLEELRVDVARYVRGGQDERLHTSLLKDIDRLDRQMALSTRL